MLAVYKHFMLTKLSKPGQKYFHKSDYKASLTAAGTGSAKELKEQPHIIYPLIFSFKEKLYGKKHIAVSPYCTSANPYEFFLYRTASVF